MKDQLLLQERSFEVVLQDQLRRLRESTGNEYRIVAPGSALESIGLRYVGTVPDILPQRAASTNMADKYASHIVVQLPHTPTDMRAMFDHAGKHLLRVAKDALDLELWHLQKVSVRNALDAEGLSEVGAIFMIVQDFFVADNGAEDGPYTYDVRPSGSSWTENFSHVDDAFEPYMQSDLNLTARFTLAARLWLRVSRVTAHDIVDMVRDRFVSDDDDHKTALNGIHYSLRDGSVIEVHLPAHDGSIFRDSASPEAVSVKSLARSLASAHSESALVPCAVAAGLSQADAVAFVRKLRRPHRKATKRPRPGDS